MDKYNGAIDYEVRLEMLPTSFVYSSSSQVFSRTPGVHIQDFHFPTGIARTCAVVVVDNIKVMFSYQVQGESLLHVNGGLSVNELEQALEKLNSQRNDTCYEPRQVLLTLARGLISVGCVWPWTRKPQFINEGYDGARWNREGVIFYSEPAAEIKPYVEMWKSWAELPTNEVCRVLEYLNPVLQYR